MLFHGMLRDAALEHLHAIAKTDIVIGLPTDRVKATLVCQSAERIIAGLATHYPQYKAVIINADTGRDASLRQKLSKLSTPQTEIVAGRYDGVRGQGAAVSAILDGALHLNAKAILILESQTRSIQPDWVAGLAAPILADQADLLKPRYTWPLPDGAMSDLLYYPFNRALWGLNLRHPAAGDFALSPRLALDVLHQDVWYTEVSKAGIDIWLSTFAITEGYRVAQSALGEKIYSSRRPGKKANAAFVEAIGTMLRQVHLRYDKRPQPPRVTSIPTLTQFAPIIDNQAVPVQDVDYLIEALALGWITYRRQWQRSMRPEHLAEVERLASQPNQRFYFPSDLWARIVYDFAVVYNKGDGDPDALTSALYPLYLGRLASFWTEVAGLTLIGREGTVSAQAVEFEEHLDYLEERWETYHP